MRPGDRRDLAIELADRAACGASGSSIFGRAAMPSMAPRKMMKTSFLPLDAPVLANAPGAAVTGPGWIQYGGALGPRMQVLRRLRARTPAQRPG